MPRAIDAGAAQKGAACARQCALQHAFDIVETVGNLLPCFGGKHGIGHQEDRHLVGSVGFGERVEAKGVVPLGAIGRVVDDEQGLHGSGLEAPSAWRRSSYSSRWISPLAKRSSRIARADRTGVLPLRRSLSRAVRNTIKTMIGASPAIMKSGPKNMPSPQAHSPWCIMASLPSISSASRSPFNGGTAA